MTGPQNHDPLSRLWKEQDMTTTTIDPRAVAARAERFGSRIRSRNLIEYAVGAAVAVFFAAVALGAFGSLADPLADLVHRIGAGAIVVGVIVMAWQLHARAAAPPAPEAAPTLAYHLVALRRQRDALRSAWAWYVGPLVPGMALLFIGIGMVPGANLPVLALIVAVALTVLGVVAWLNLMAARALEREIAALEADAGA